MGNEISREKEYDEKIKEIDKVLISIWAHKEAIKNHQDDEDYSEEWMLLEEQEKQLKTTKHDLQLLKLTGSIATVSISKGERINKLKEDITIIKAKEKQEGDGIPRQRKKKPPPSNPPSLPEAPTTTVKIETISLEERFKLLAS
jgi:hypothetical protein